jgi:hypothetical protein
MFGEQVFVLWKVKSEQVFGRTSVRIHDPRSPELFENIDIGWATIRTIFNVGFFWIDLSKLVLGQHLPCSSTFDGGGKEFARSVSTRASSVMGVLLFCVS